MQVKEVIMLKKQNGSDSKNVSRSQSNNYILVTFFKEKALVRSTSKGLENHRRQLNWMSTEFFSGEVKPLRASRQGKNSFE